VRQLANKLFDIDYQARQLPGSTKTRQLIVDTSLEYLTRLGAEVHGDTDLSLEIGNAFMRVARVQGVPISPNLGQMDQAGHSLQIAEKFVETALASRPANRTALLRSAQIAHDRMILASFNGRREEALAFARKADDRLQKFHVVKSDEPEASAVLTTYMNVTSEYLRQDQLDDAFRLSDQAKEAARALKDPRYLGMFFWTSSRAFRNGGDLEQALKDIRESVRLLTPGPGQTQQGRLVNFALVLAAEASILGDSRAVSLGRPQEGIPFIERAFDIVDGLAHQDSHDQNSRGSVGQTGVALGDMLRHSNPRRALAVYDHVLQHVTEIKDNVNLQQWEIAALSGSSYPLRQLGRPAEAQRRLDRAFQLLNKIKLYPADKISPGSDTDLALCALAEQEVSIGHFGRALELYEQLLRAFSASDAKPETSLPHAVDVARIYGSMASMQRRSGHRDRASELEAQRLELWRSWERKLPQNAFVLRQIAGVRTN
jgi:tetratricopeptide (TPR) repeat protein